MTLIWTTLPCLVDAQLEADDALDPQALRLGRVDVLAAGRGDQLRVLRDVDLGDRHEPAGPVTRRQLRFFDARARVWSSASGRPAPRRTNRPRWSRSATRRSWAADRPTSPAPRWEAAARAAGPWSACDGRCAASARGAAASARAAAGGLTSGGGSFSSTSISIGFSARKRLGSMVANPSASRPCSPIATTVPTPAARAPRGPGAHRSGSLSPGAATFATCRLVCRC